MVVEDMQKAFDKGGKNSLDQISKLYGEQIQDFEKFDSVIKDFDFSKSNYYFFYIITLMELLFQHPFLILMNNKD